MRQLEPAIARTLNSELLARYRLVERAIDALRADQRRENQGLARLTATADEHYKRDYVKTESKLLAGEQAYIPSPETDKSSMGASSYRPLRGRCGPA